MVTSPQIRKTITSKNLLETGQLGRFTNDYKNKSEEKKRDGNEGRERILM